MDFLVGIVSGRPNVELREMFPTDDVICVGNHGLEIAGWGFEEVVPRSKQIRAEVSAIVRKLSERLKEIQGSRVRDKGLTVAVHYRSVGGPNIEVLKRIVGETVGGSETFTITQGKLVLEIRPDIPSNKGTAVIRVLERMFGADWRDSCLAIYMGDDLIDEDAFSALENGNVTVRVDAKPGETAAKYFVQDPSETAEFLAWLGRIRRN
ncbi:MAG: trehalose-phosphatase, partial [Candidatus Geothermarchaeales archaeon]